MQMLKRRSDAIYLTEMGAFIARRINLMMGGMFVVKHVLDTSVNPPLPVGEGRGEGTRTHLLKETK
ncbi:TPA: hypothetical protein QIC98_000045 [Enterobacter hormaechei subsp. xiangfangensis]|nr:hypothetical protein [Enterobacter hormaechei subsp. xiangfangensis]